MRPLQRVRRPVLGSLLSSLQAALAGGLVLLTCGESGEPNVLPESEPEPPPLGSEEEVAVQILSRPIPHRRLGSANLEFLQDDPLGACPYSQISFDQVASALAEDLQSLPELDRPFIRYVSLAHQPSMGPCAADLLSAPAAVHLALNVLSLTTRRHDFPSLSAAPSVFRVDLRAMQWEQPLQVGEVEYEDAWAAIAADSRYPFLWSGDREAELQAYSSAEHLVLRLDELVSLTAEPALYAALLRQEEHLEDMLERFEINVRANLEDEAAVRAGMVTDGGFLLADRHDLEIRQGAFWMLYELPARSTDGEDGPWYQRNEGFYALTPRFSEPVNVLYQLPNSFYAFARFDADGQRLSGAAGGEDAAGTLACAGCHQAGPLPMVDVVTPLAPPWYSGPSPIPKNAPRVWEVIGKWFPPPYEFEEVVEDDLVYDWFQFSGVAYRVVTAEPMSFQQLARFREDLDSVVLAGELMIPEEQLDERWEQLHPDVRGSRVIQTSYPNRERWSELYLQTGCLFNDSPLCPAQ